MELTKLGDKELVKLFGQQNTLAQEAELLRRLSGSGAAASPQPSMDEIIQVLGSGWKDFMLADKSDLAFMVGKVLTAIAKVRNAPASSGPRPVCPKCGSPKVVIEFSWLYLRASVCRNCKHEDFPAAFFPASLNGEKRAPELSCDRCLGLSCHIFKPKRRAATTQGTPEWAESK